MNAKPESSADEISPEKTEEKSAEKKSEEIMTVSTDKVDNEIAELKNKQAQLLKSAKNSGDGELKKELAAVNEELRRKDNDTYRRQNAVFRPGVDIEA